MKKILALAITGLLCVSMFSVFSAQVKGSPGSAPDVVCVPFHGENPAVPHDAWIGKEIILKGTAHDKDGDATMVAYKWDFGDGYCTDWIYGVNPYIIEAKHTYTGTMADGTPYGVGKYFTAWLYVKDNEGLIGKDCYFIAIRDKTLDVEVNVALDNGLWWLHKQQIRSTYADGTEYGYWYSPHGYHVAFTAAATEAFELLGHLPSGNRDEDPYVETVQRGLNYLFNQFYTYSISQHPTYCPLGNPDMNGNGIGLACFSGDITRQIYESGMALMTISSSRTPDRIATTGTPDVLGRSYKEIVQDMVDFMAWAQSDPYTGVYEGGWRYYANYGQSDNSVSQWPVIGMEAAERNFGAAGVKVPEFVRPELLKWLAYSQGADGGFGYMAPGNWENTAKTGAGCAMLYWAGVPVSDMRFQKALDFLNVHWYDTAWSYTNFGDYYTMYAIMKGMRIPHPNIEFIGTHDWYAEYARYIVDEQNAYGGEYVVDHSWLGEREVKEVLATAWAMAVLIPTLVMPGPVADAGPDIDNFPPTIPVKFDASGSYHRDPTKSIVLYEWDFESDGIWDYSGLDLKVEHAYPAYYKPDGSIDWDLTAKDYTATLRVTDNSDPPLHDTDTCVVHITPPPWKPVADPDGPYEGYPGVRIQLDGSKSFDPESIMYPPDHPWHETIAKYEWDLDNDGQFDDSTEIKPSWTWEAPGVYSVGLKVTDSQSSGPGGSIGPLDVDIKYTTVVIKTAKVVNLGLVPINTADNPIEYSKSYFEELGEKITNYFIEVSYGTLNVKVEIYNDTDGNWFSVPEATNWYSERSWTIFIEHAIDSCDNAVDFRRYDYHEANGKGIVAFITSEDIWGRGPFVGPSDGLGHFETDDGVKVDAIYIGEHTDEVTLIRCGERYTLHDLHWLGENKIIRALAHEFAHALGKILVTSVSKDKKDCSWFLPDLYLRGNVNLRWDLTGEMFPCDLSTEYYRHMSVEKVHLCSYTKEWLNWLKYKDANIGDTCTVKALSLMKYNDEVFRYCYKKPWWEGAPHFYILEHRTSSADKSDWDTDTLYAHVLAFYQVDLKIDFPWCRPDTVDLVRTMTETGVFSDPDVGVTFRLISINDEESTVIIEKYEGKKLKGASITTEANVLSLAMPVIKLYDFVMIVLPDIDLHAYSSDGKHVGINYQTGEYEVQIPGAIASGDIMDGREWIFVPEDVEVRFAVSTKDVEKFLNVCPGASNLTDGTEKFALSLVYYDPDGNRWESTPSAQQIGPGQTIWYTPVIIKNPDGTYSTGLTQITWEYIFEDPMRHTILKISTNDKHFQFVSPDKEFLVKHDPYMKITNRAIVIIYKDWEIKIATVAVDTKLDFCVATAWDQQTGKRYFLIDKVGNE